MISTSANSEQTAEQSAPEFIEMRGISKRFGGVRALTDVSFSIRSGEIHCLAGENGCGKSTLIKILSGVHNPDEGEIILEGKAHSHLSPAASQRFGVQIIYQDLSLFPNLSVAENIAFRHHVEAPAGLVNRQTMKDQARAVMERLKISLPMDALVGMAVFGEAADKEGARTLLWQLGQAVGVKPASIHDLYLARAWSA